MTCLQTTLPASGTVPALRTLTQPLTPLAMSGRILFRSAAIGTDPGHAGSPPDAAEIEYASWMPDPGAIELASWTAHMRASLR